MFLHDTKHVKKDHNAIFIPTRQKNYMFKFQHNKNW